MTEQIVNCVDITGYDPDLPGEVTKHFADVGGVYGGIWYEERLKQPGLYTTNLFSAGTTSGESQVGSGETVLANSDGKLDYLANWGFDGRSIVFKQFTESLGLVLVMGCTMQQPTFTSTDVSILTKDGLAKLNVPIQTTTYGGTNVAPGGIDGSDDIKGSAKPLVFGPVYNITVKEVNTSKLIFQVHEGAAAIPAAYDMGVPLLQESDYTDESDMMANAPAEGKYRVWSSATYGTFARLGSSPAGTVTFDVVEGATAADRTAAQIAKRMALRALTSGEISSADVSALDAKNSAEVGIYIADGSTTTILQCLDQVLGSIGAWYVPDINGVLRMGRLEAPAGTPDITLTDGTDITNLERVRSNDAGKGVPAYKVNLRYQKNWTVQSGSDLAGSIGSFKWNIHTLPTTANWQGLAYGNGIFVLTVGSTNTVYSSPDGINWTLRSMPVSAAWHRVTYGGGKFVAVATGTTAAYSLDGITWVQCTMPSSQMWWDVTYGGGKFVAVDANGGGKVAVSTDGINWTENSVSGMSGYSMTQVSFGNGVFVITASTPSSCKILTSFDGATWASDDAVFVTGIVTFGNGVFVILETPGSPANRAAISKDGIIWEIKTLPTSAQWYIARYCGDRFVLVPDETSQATLISTDGVSWEVLWISSPVAHRWKDVAYGQGRTITIQNQSDVSAIFDSITPESSRTWYSNEYRTVTDQDASVQTAHLLSPELNFDTLLIDLAAAQAECTRRLNLYKVRRDMLQGDVPSSVRAYVQPGKQVKLYGPRYYLSSGKQFIEIGIVVDWESNKTTPLLWG
jgi:hypothetical protein